MHSVNAVLSFGNQEKKLAGRLKNPGVKWDRTPQLVNDHDFRPLADGLAIPYGIYDLQDNAGACYAGRSHDAPQFAVDCIVKWRRTEGRARYPGAAEMVILADAGGSNGWRFEVESGRTQIILGDLEKLGRRSAGQFRDRLALSVHHPNKNRTDRNGQTG